MKNIKYFLFSIILFLIGLNPIAAKNKLYDLSIRIKLNENGSANITEVWNMSVDKGTEVYKPMGSLSNIEISNFKVVDEKNNTYTFINDWDVHGTLESKKYKNGFNYSDSLELCWGMSSYGKHIYTITYDVSNFIFNTEDAQVAYWKLVNDSMDPAPENVNVIISGPTSYEDTLDVWGYGYKGYAYVKDGAIQLQTEDSIDYDEYMVVLVKFPQDTFQTNNSYPQFNTFNDVLESADENTFDYDYKNKKNYFIDIFLSLFLDMIPFIIMAIVIGATLRSKISNSNYDFGEAGQKIDKKNINNFRDIPCKKDIFRAYFISQIYGINKKKEDFLGAILLKWLLNDQVSMTITPKKLFKKETSAIDLKDNIKSTNILELKLYNMLKLASKDGILESKELERWCRANYSYFFKWFEDTIETEREKLINEGLITKIESKKIFKPTRYVVNPQLKEEAIQLAGLKKYLEEFSRINEKQAIEVKLWKEYLMYAQIFGIADKVAKQFKDLYPEIVEQTSGYDLGDIIILNHWTSSWVSAASSARSAAESYSSGGGGFSSGGGGGGSFGGGSGGGCR